MDLRLAMALGATVWAASAAPAQAQNVRPVVFGSVGLAHVYRADDRGFGTETNAGGGAGIEWKRLGAEVEIHRTFGLTPEPAQCAVVNVQCVGQARAGVLEATMITGNVTYMFSAAGVRPYVIGSVGALRSETVNSVSRVVDGTETLSEFLETDTGLALGVGAGLEIPLGRSVSLRPEFRTYTSSALSRTNLGMHRVTVGLRYRW